MGDQISFIPWPGMTEEQRAAMERQAKILFDYVDNQKKKKRNWENAFQKWSDEQSQNGYEPYGSCGFGSMCDWCKDNSYGRPCVRALNAMCREKGIVIDYSERDFKKIWNGR